MDWDKLVKAYVVQRAIKEAAKASKSVKRSWKNFDPDEVLHKVGLTTYKPARFGAGAFSLVMAGAVIGGAVALLFAPKRGTEFRNELMGKLKGPLADRPSGIGVESAMPRADTSPGNMRI